MIRTMRNSGFSLTELLFALGVLAIGMVFVAGVFPAGVAFTTASTENTIATVVAEEAFAKVRLLAWHPTDPAQIVSPGDFLVDQLRSFDAILKLKRPTVDPLLIDEELMYPSHFDPNMPVKKYYWRALCRRLTADPASPVQVTVFVCRMIGAGGESDPDYIGVNATAGSQVISVTGGDEDMVHNGSILVENSTGFMYRVRGSNLNNPAELSLTEPWRGVGGNSAVWLVPPGANSSRNPCIAVYQRVIRF